jgi:asparaginyl-tRNA synthetase
LEVIASRPYVRVSYTEGIEILQRSGQSFEFPVSYGVDLQTEHERYLTETHFKKPVIVYNYPREIKPFYMRVNDDGKTVAAMDLLVPRVGELIGGSQREERLEVLEQRLRDFDLEPDAYWWYLDIRRFGTTPHAGFGLGFERFLMMVTGVTNIRDVIPFPRTPKHLEF